MSQKVYSIKINGLEEGITQAEALLRDIELLEQRLGKIGTSNAKIIDKSQVELQKEIRKNLELSNEEYLKNIQNTEKIKQQNKEIVKYNKEIAQGIRDQNGEFTNTLQGQRAYLAELKKSLASMELDTEGWNEMSQKVLEVNERVKDLEKSYGVFNREVGHYENATKGLQAIENSVDDVKTSLEEFRSKALFDVQLGDTVVQFDDIGQAISEIDKLAQKASASLMAMKAAGEENTEEYVKMQQQFEMYATKSGELQRAVKLTDQLKDSVASTTAGLDQAIRGFQEVGSVLQISASISGMFGKNQEEIQKAMNATVQIMGLMQAAQQLINSTKKKGSIIAKAYAVSMKGADKAMKAFGISTTASSKAVKAFRTALISTGIGALVAAIGLAVTGLMKFIEKSNIFKSTATMMSEKLQEVTEKFNAMQSAMSKVTDLKLELGLLTPLEAANEKLDIAKRKVEAFTKSLINVTKNGKNLGKVLSKEAFAAINNLDMDNPEKLAEQLDVLQKEYARLEIAALSAKDSENGLSDSFTIQDKQAMELIGHIIDLGKAYGDVDKATKKENEDAEKQRKKLLDAERELAKKRIDNIKSDWTKRRLTLKEEYKKELEDVKDAGKLRGEMEIEIRKKYLNQMLELEQEYQYEREKAQRDMILAEMISRTKSINTITKFYETMYSKEADVYADSIESSIESIFISEDDFHKAVPKALTSYNLDIDHFFKALTDSYKERMGLFVGEVNLAWQGEVKELMDFFGQYQTDEDFGGDLEKTLDQMFAKPIENVGTSLISNFSTIQYILKERMDKTKNLLKQQQKDLKELGGLMPQDDKSVEANRLAMLEAIGVSEETLKIAEAQYHKLENIINSFKEKKYDIMAEDFSLSIDEQSKYFAEMQKKYHIVLEKINEEVDDEMTKITDKLQFESTGYESIDLLGKFLGSKQVINNNKKMLEDYQKSIKTTFDSLVELGKEYTEEMTVLNVLIEDKNDEIEQLVEKNLQLREKIKKALETGDTEKANALSAEFDATSQTIHQANAELILLQNTFNNYKNATTDVVKQTDELEKVFDKISKVLKGDKLSFKDVVTSMAEMASIVAEISNAFTQNRLDAEMAWLEKQQELLDDELEMLDEQLSAKEELIDKYNDNINTIENELESARGDRRMFLLDQINEEMAAREREFAQQQQLLKQQQDAEKKQEEYERRRELIEQQKKRAQKRSDIAQATAQTALGVVRTLGAYPYPTNAILAALVGALGAAQIGIIATQQYADGGLLQGPAHSQGGIKVLGGTAEVEGNEYITNKVTTMNNLELLEFINSKKRKIDLGDLVEFYFGGGRSRTLGGVKFADGGQLPNANLNVKRLTSQWRDDRPIYVSVTEIESVQNRVRNVRALAGDV